MVHYCLSLFVCNQFCNSCMSALYRQSTKRTPSIDIERLFEYSTVLLFVTDIILTQNVSHVLESIPVTRWGTKALKTGNIMNRPMRGQCVGHVIRYRPMRAVTQPGRGAGAGGDATSHPWRGGAGTRPSRRPSRQSLKVLLDQLLYFFSC